MYGESDFQRRPRGSRERFLFITVAVFPTIRNCRSGKSTGASAAENSARGSAFVLLWKSSHESSAIRERPVYGIYAQRLLISANSNLICIRRCCRRALAFLSSAVCSLTIPIVGIGDPEVADF